MSTGPLECATEACMSTTEPPAPNHEPVNEENVDLPYRISIEHCYSRLVPFRSSPPPCSTDQSASYPTIVLFENCVSNKRKLEGLNRKWGGQPQEVEIRKKDVLDMPACNGVEENVSAICAAEEDLPVDVVTVDPVPYLPYDEKKVSSIMIECARHINLVKIPAENSELLLNRAIQEASYQRRALLRRLINILEADHLARLTYANVPHEPIKRRLNTDKAARQFRKALADVQWDVKLTRYCHETLLQVLSSDLLPIYLDILQVLKAKCPVLVENMIHSSMGLVGNEAFGLLLKRPWNPAVGLYTMEKQVKFESAPLFVTLPYSTTGLGGRRVRMLQTQLGVLGKVFPVMLPERIVDMAHGMSLKSTASLMMSASLTRVQELQSQFPGRPIVLIAFSIAGRIAAKISELEAVSCIVSIGLPVHGLYSSWTVGADPFKECKTPTVFIVGSESNVSSMQYMEDLRSTMSCPTSLIVVGGGDDLVRMSAEDKSAETVCQSIVDRCILDKVYNFIVHMLPCSYPNEQARLTRKHKGSHTDEIGSMFLTPAVAQSPIRLCSPVEDLPTDSRNVNSNNSNTPKYMKHGTGKSPALSNRSTPSPVSLLGKRQHPDTTCRKKPVQSQDLPKVGRPRSKSISDPYKRRNPVRPRSCSSDQADTERTLVSGFPTLTSSLLTLNTNTNNNISPPGLLALPQANIQPLPITPPRNPFAEDVQGGSTNLKLDPKTIKQLQKGR